MTLHLPDKWLWDFWFARDGADYHLFYLQADRSLGNPDLRHWHSSIGHAVSQDLMQWEILPDALRPSPEPGVWDNYTTWTGSVMQHAGLWYLFYTGSRRSENGLIQRIGLATSTDLMRWTEAAREPAHDAGPALVRTAGPQACGMIRPGAIPGSSNTRRPARSMH